MPAMISTAADAPAMADAVRRLLDDFLPPVIREWRPLNRWMATRVP